MQFLAGRFAAKESVSKSFRTGIGGGYSFTDIEILNDEKGAPLVYIKGVLRSDIEISISHDRHYAMAVSLVKR
jgi:holo-[acyl-carrier protein] synthase